MLFISAITDLAVLNAFKSEYAKADGIEPQLLALKKVSFDTIIPTFTEQVMRIL